MGNFAMIDVIFMVHVFKKREYMYTVYQLIQIIYEEYIFAHIKLTANI